MLALKTCFLLLSVLLALTLGLVSCGNASEGDLVRASPINADDYQNRVHGSWVATMVANHSGLDLQGIWIDDPGPGETLELTLLDQWSTDDDTHIEWLDLHLSLIHI